MKRYWIAIERTQKMVLELDEEEIGENDPEEFAWYLANGMPNDDWEISDTFVEIEREWEE